MVDSRTRLRQIGFVDLFDDSSPVDDGRAVEFGGVKVGVVEVGVCDLEFFCVVLVVQDLDYVAQVLTTEGVRFTLRGERNLASGGKSRVMTAVRKVSEVVAGWSDGRIIPPTGRGLKMMIQWVIPLRC